MNTSRLADLNMGPEVGCDSQDEADTQFLLLMLKELLDRLSGLSEGGPVSASGDVERWEGGEYLYLEAVLQSSVDAEIDMSIQGGRAFIRVVR